MSSLKKNIIANYGGQLYVSVVGILTLPLYIKYMGQEAYGLVGFFAALQACFVMLDAGLTPTIARETARFNGGVMSAVEYRQIFRVINVLFVSIAIIGGGGVWISSEKIATYWLNVSNLPIGHVILSVQIMVVSVIFRWLGGLYRGVIVGFECLVWLSGFNIFIATLRFVAVFGVMWLFGYTPVVFFTHQLVVALVELLGLIWKTSRLLPSLTSLNQSVGWSFSSLRPLLKFALTIAFTSSVWVLVTQSDKLVLSGILSLSDYGYFTLGVLVASSVIMVNTPIANAIMPRMARLYAEGKPGELIDVYRGATQVISVVAGALSVTLFTCSEQLLYAWTGDLVMAKNVTPVLQLYAAGNGLLALSAFPYYLQYAKGSLRYHFFGNVAMIFCMVPLIVYFSHQFGSVGAGYVWLGINFIYFVFWTAYVHSKLAPKLHLRWMLKDVVAILFPGLGLAFFIGELEISLNGRLDAAVYSVATGMMVLFASVVASEKVRDRMVSKFKSFGQSVQSDSV